LKEEKIFYKMVTKLHFVFTLYLG